MQLLRIVDSFVGTLELFDFLEQLRLGLDMGKHLSADQHLIEDKSRTPYITFLVILFKFKHFRSRIKRRTGTFGHLDFQITSQAKIGDFEFFVLVEKDVVRFEVTMEFI